MSSLRRVQGKLWGTTEETCQRLGRWVASENASYRIPVMLALGTVMVVGMGVGLINHTTKSSLSELYVHEDSRMHQEFDRVKETFGGLSRTQMLIVTDKDDASAVTRQGLSAWLDLLTPIMKKDESFYCNQWDGLATSRPAECSEGQFAKSLYCNCELVAGNDDMITISVQGTNADGTPRTVALSEADLCESPTVQPALAASTHPSLRTNEETANSSALFAALYAASLDSKLATARVEVGGLITAGGGFVDEGAAKLAEARDVCITTFQSSVGHSPARKKTKKSKSVQASTQLLLPLRWQVASGMPSELAPRVPRS
eukprot:m.240337 g.240337  ORF g.240337 m.240337 type:complete len:316 (-) comp18987_c1_seq4:4527-5474(-)